jgi:hypothetical protein
LPVLRRLKSTRDAIVKIVEAGKVPQKELQIELLESAFQSARTAHEPVRLIAIPQTPLDTRELYRGKGGDMRLDAISLQARVLKEMLTLDRPKARHMFEGLAHPVLDVRPCEDPFVADVAPYYEIAASIAQSAFSDEEKKHDAHVQLLIALLAGARSSNELAAFASVIDNVALTHAQSEQVIGAFSAKLASMGADYRSLAVFYNMLDGSVRKLADFASANRIDDSGLTDGFRKFLVAQMTAGRCSPDIPIEFKEQLSEEETAPASHGADMVTHLYFDTGDAKDIGDKLLDIRSKGGGRVAGQLQEDGHFKILGIAPPSIEVQNGVGDLLHDFILWQPRGSDADVLHQKATLLTALLRMTARIDEFPKIASMAVSLLTTSGAQKEAPAEWMWQVKSLASTGGPKMLDLYRASGNSGLVVYAALWK